MRDVAVIGVGLHPFGRFPDKSVVDLARVAIEEALDDSGVPFKDIDVAYCGHVYQPMRTGQSIIHEFGKTGIPVVNLEVACTSSTQALIRATYEIATGLYDVALCVGVEKMERGMLAGLTMPGSYEELMGLRVMPAIYSFAIRRHMHDYGTTAEQLALCSVKAHKNGTLNPNAQYQKACTVEEVLESRMIADPITLLMCCPSSDGASAAVVCASDLADKYTANLGVKVAGWAISAGGYPSKGETEDECEAKIVAKKAFEMAGLGPNDIDVVQIHDAFSPGEILIPEYLGLIPKGEGGPWVEAGKTAIEGELPINTDGGLVSRGHPLGATGLAQVAELVRQLRREAGPRQVARPPEVALQYNTGEGGSSLTILTK